MRNTCLICPKISFSLEAYILESSNALLQAARLLYSFLEPNFGYVMFAQRADGFTVFAMRDEHFSSYVQLWK